ncbi:MAG: DUF1043 family protein [Wenzhouxiangellaceae bacterium]|nr:DUF1043 family protein [Wenzhouxiangellaceae bacterium]
MEIWIWSIVGLLIGGALGALACWFAMRRSSPQSSLRAIKRENEEFREQVNAHFVETARLINRMTDSYKDVFDHLSQGAEKLVDEKALAERMPQVSDREVRLKHLGKSTAAGKDGGGSKPSASGSGKPVGNSLGARPGDRDPKAAGKGGSGSGPSNGKSSDSRN